MQTFKLLNKHLSCCTAPTRLTDYPEYYCTNKTQSKNDINTVIRKAKAHFKNKEKDIENREFRI